MSGSAVQMEYDYLFKFLILGNCGVGKTSFLRRLADGEFCDRYVSTVGVDFREMKVVHQPLDGSRSQRVRIQIWDTAGQERFRSLTTSFFRGSMGFILIFDLTNEQSFLDVNNWLVQIETHSLFDNPDVVLCGNKSDMEERRVVKKRDVLALAERHRLVYFETSACTGHGLNNSVERLVQMVMKRMEAAMENDFVPKKERPLDAKDFDFTSRYCLEDSEDGAAGGRQRCSC